MNSYMKIFLGFLSQLFQINLHTCVHAFWHVYTKIGALQASLESRKLKYPVLKTAA